MIAFSWIGALSAPLFAFEVATNPPHGFFWWFMLVSVWTAGANAMILLYEYHH